jgi:ABC-type transport system substrate-binding protein
MLKSFSYFCKDGKPYRMIGFCMKGTNILTAILVLSIIISTTMPCAQTEANWELVLFGGGGPLDDPRVQAAVMRAVNWPELSREISKNQSIPIVFELPLEDKKTPIKELAYDPDRAKRFLMEAGYPDGFKIKLFYPPFSGFPPMAKRIASDLEKIGIEVEQNAADDGLAKLTAILATKMGAALALQGRRR